MNEPKINWPDLLECYYGVSLNDHQALVWFGEMPGATNTDLCAAIRRAANEGAKPIEYRATVRDVIQWLKVYRAIEYKKRNKEAEAAKLNAFKDEWKEKLSRGCPEGDFISAVDGLIQYGVVERNDICREVLGK